MSEFRSWYYDDLKENYSKFFNFFFENNDIFNIISEEDEQSLKIKHMEYLNCTFNWTIGSFLGVLVTDKIILRYFYFFYRLIDIYIQILEFKIFEQLFFQVNILEYHYWDLKLLRIILLKMQMKFIDKWQKNTALIIKIITG